MTGIYMITIGDDENAHVYIGQSVNIERRKNDHLRKLMNRSHDNSYMQSVYNKYGEECMSFEILCECSADKLNELEEYYIFTMQTFVGDNPLGMNMNTGGGGYNILNETRAKLREVHKGKTHNVSKETRAKISEANKGKTLSEETKQKISKAGKGRKMSEKSKQKMSEAHKGHVVSDETKAKISEAKKGKFFSDEHRQKLSEAKKGKSCKPVHCVELEKIFPSVMEANRFMQNEFGIVANVSSVLTGERKTTGGFHWEYCSPNMEG